MEGQHPFHGFLQRIFLYSVADLAEVGTLRSQRQRVPREFGGYNIFSKLLDNNCSRPRWGRISLQLAATWCPKNFGLTAEGGLVYFRILSADLNEVCYKRTAEYCYSLKSFWNQYALKLILNKSGNQICSKEQKKNSRSAPRMLGSAECLQHNKHRHDSSNKKMFLSKLRSFNILWV